MMPPRPSRGTDVRTLVVAGLSVRALAESARQGGWRVIALDLFGDRDTRRVADHWACVGEPSALRIDPARLRQALRWAAAIPGVEGWVPGSGFESMPELLDAGGAALPCLAMPAHAVRRLRSPDAFFGTLDRHGLAHPEVSCRPPADPRGWLAKRAGGCGGVHIVEATHALSLAGTAPRDRYFQRAQAGAPMSALFVADGVRFRQVALNRLIVLALGPLPHVYAGAVGPVRDAAIEHVVDRALATLVPGFGLRGLASLDFIHDGADIHLLEVNPRPPATMQLHAHAWPQGLMRVHVDAVAGRLPTHPPAAGIGVRGHLTVFAPRRGRFALHALADCAAGAPRTTGMADGAPEGPPSWLHDIPSTDALLAPGDPVCSVSADAADLDAAMRLLASRAAQVVRHGVAPAVLSHAGSPA